MDTSLLCTACTDSIRQRTLLAREKKPLKFRVMKRKSLLFLLLAGFIYLSSTAQTVPFEGEVKEISARIDSAGWTQSSTVFTGSSTIRMWKDVQSVFPNTPILNTGFGGSKASDLEKHLFPLVIRFEPSRVFIYEGDNDIWANVPVTDIMTSIDHIVSRLLMTNPNTEVFLIGAKPSPSRWEKKENYTILNQQLAEYCRARENVTFVDTWKPLTDSEGNPRPELYLEDQLHLNAQGYEIWNEIFRPLIENLDQ